MEEKEILFGAVDLGSNSFRVEIGRLEGEQIVTQSYWKETVRLAGGFDENGALTPEIQERALAALARFKERLANIPLRHIRAVGTQALRVATNSDTFLQKAENALGCPIEILRGREEARLVFQGCAHRLPLSDKRRLVVDIGGGSTEFIIGCGYKTDCCESYHVGCVNTSIAFFADGRLSRKAFEKARLACQAEFEESRSTFSAPAFDEAFGSAGTFGAISEIVRNLGWSDGTVRQEHIDLLAETLIAQKDIQSIHFVGLKDDRREVIAGGLAVLAAVMSSLNVTEMKPVSGGLRVGLLYDLLGRRSHRDTREITVSGLLSRLGIDQTQAQRVRNIVGKIYSALVPNADMDDRQLLLWAAQLHEIGTSISTSGYHRHSQYIIANADLAGFSKRDQDMIATIALAQRGSLKKVLNALANDVLLWQILALRLSIIFAHARYDVELPEIEVRQNNNTTTLLIPSLWLDAHPLTDYMLARESDYWHATSYEIKIERK